MSTRATLLVLATLASGAAAAYETPKWRAVDLLPPAEQVGMFFTVKDPITTDGLMHQYSLDTKFGPMLAYGHRELQARLREIHALEVASDTNDLDVIADTTRRRVEGTFKTVADAARDPIGLVQGLPRGIVNLFKGTAAQARQFSRSASKAVHEKDDDHAEPNDDPLHDKARRAGHAASRYADHYLGLSADERAWYERLGVDPYTDNEALRRVVRHLARVESATSLGLRFASLPSIPFTGDLQRVMDNVYHEDPAVLRERRREALLGYGLSADEVDDFESSMVLTPTRQLRLATAAAGLDGVAGLAVFFRQVTRLKSADEADIYVSGVERLSAVHREHPLGAVLPSIRLPGATYADGSGSIVVVAVESLYWTPLVDEGEQVLRAGLPATTPSAQLWIAGAVSDEAQRQLSARGWQVRGYAFEDSP